MITVRFPSGFSVQHNSGNFVQRYQSYSDIYEKQGGKWLAHVPNDALIEVVSPCRMYQAGDEQPWKIVTEMRREIESLKRKLKKVGVL